MSTNPDEPVIIATFTHRRRGAGRAAADGGCHGLYQAAVSGRERVPSLWLTAEEIRAIRRTATLGPGPGQWAAGTENQP